MIFVPEGTPVRIAEPVQCHVYVTDKDGKQTLSANRVTIPAGWYAASLNPETTKP